MSARTLDEIRRVAQGIADHRTGATEARPAGAPPALPADDGEPTLRRPPHLDPAALHGPLGTIVRIWAPYTEAHPAGILFGLITTFGAMLGRATHTFTGATEHYPNLFALLVGVTANARKGTSQAIVQGCMRLVDPSFMATRTAGGLSTGEGLIYQVIDPPEPKDGSDPPPKDKRLLVQESEMATVYRRMGREGNSLSGVLRQGWDGSPLATLTKGTAGIDAGGLRAREAHIAVVGQVNPTELRKYLGDSELASGFGNRWLYCWVERTRICPNDARPREEVLRPYTDTLASALHGPRPAAIALSTAGRDLWFEMYHQLSDGAPGRVGELTARGAPYVRRLAMIYALADGETFVRPVHLKAACAVWRYSVDSVRYIFGDTVFSTTAAKLLESITDAGPKGIDLTEVRRASGTRHLSADDRHRALQELLDAGLVKATDEHTRGRSRTRLRLTRFALPTGGEEEAISATSARTDAPPDAHVAPIALNAGGANVVAEAV